MENNTTTTNEQAQPQQPINDSQPEKQALISSSTLTKFHAGYFRISLSLSSQALLWKVLTTKPTNPNSHALSRLFHAVPETAFSFLWSLALFTALSQSLIYAVRCVLRPRSVKAEFLHRVGVNYLFAPWTAWLFLLQSSPFVGPKSLAYRVLWWGFVVPVLVLDVKIYGQWFTKGKRLLSAVANPASQLSVIGNLAAARAAAEMGWRECAIFMFSLGVSHYLVLFVTLYQRLAGCDSLPDKLRPAYFLFIAAPSMASLAWCSISGSFDPVAKMFFFLSLFLFMSLASRPALFGKAMRKFNIAWWGYSFPLAVLALASAEYAEEVKLVTAYTMMIVLSALSFLVCLVLIVVTAIHSNKLLPNNSNTTITTSNNINTSSSDTSPRGCDSV